MSSQSQPGSIYTWPSAEGGQLFNHADSQEDHNTCGVFQRPFSPLLVQALSWSRHMLACKPDKTKASARHCFRTALLGSEQTPAAALPA